MNRIRLITGIILLAAVLLPASVSAKGDNVKERNVKAYIFGFAASFNDSTVYISDIQEVATAYVTQKHKHLVDRNEYSYQLRNYLTNQQSGAHPTVVTFYALSRKDAEKKYAKVKRKYTEKAKGRYIVKYIKPEDFQYTPVAHEQ